MRITYIGGNAELGQNSTLRLVTVAAVDRLVYHATIIEIRQDSFGKKTALSRSNFHLSNQPE